MDMVEAENYFTAAVAAQIRAELAAARMDQRTLAAYVGIERATLNRYLQGVRPMPLPVFFRVAQGLSLMPDELMRRAEERIKPEVTD